MTFRLNGQHADGDTSAGGLATAFKQTGDKDSDAPSIDLVCRRLTIKWEPIFNITHRYLFCRCIIRRSTPSQFIPKMDFLTLGICPRHNNVGISHLDYGNLDYHEDSYFDRFGGYDFFRLLIVIFVPNSYELLGREKFMRANDIAKVRANWERLPDKRIQALIQEIRQYIFECYDLLDESGVELPPKIAQELRAEHVRKQGESPRTPKEPCLHPEMLQDFRNSPMMREVKEILEGKWSGVPHWSVKD